MDKESSENMMSINSRKAGPITDFGLSERKDDQYWIKRSKNNESARKSRMKRKAINQGMEKQIMHLIAENVQLRLQYAKVMSVHGAIDEVTKMGIQDLNNDRDNALTARRNNFYRAKSMHEYDLYRQKIPSWLQSSGYDSDEMRNSSSPYNMSPFQRHDGYNSSASSTDNLSSSATEENMVATDKQLQAKHNQWLMENCTYQARSIPYGGQMMQHQPQIVSMTSKLLKTESFDNDDSFQKREEPSARHDTILSIPGAARFTSLRDYKERNLASMAEDSEVRKESTDENQKRSHPKIRIKHKIHSAFSTDDL